MFDNNSYDSEITKLINKFEKLLRSKQKMFFDVEEFEAIIDFYIQRDLISSAFLAVNKALDIYPNTTEIIIKKGQLFIDQKKYKQALELTELIEHISPNNYEALLIKCLALIKLRKTETAKPIINKIISLNQGFEKTDLLLSLAESFAEIGENYECLYYLEKAELNEPENTDVLCDKGLCLLRLGHNRKSINCYKKAIDINPLNDELWHGLGMAYHASNYHKKAIEAYDFAIAIDPYNIDSILGKGMAYHLLNNIEAALECYKLCSEFDPLNLDLLKILAECYRTNQNHEHEYETYQRIVEIDPDNAMAWVLLVDVALELNLDIPIEDYLKKALMLDPGNELFTAIYSKFCLETKKYDIGMVYAKKLIIASPETDEGWLLLSDFINKTKGINEAIKILKESLNKVENKTIIYSRLSNLYLEIKNKTESNKYIKKCFIEELVDFNNPNQLIKINLFNNLENRFRH